MGEISNPAFKSDDTAANYLAVKLEEKYESSQMLQSLFDTKEGEIDVKPCVADLLVGPNSELHHGSEAPLDEAKESQIDVKPCFRDLPNVPNFELLDSCERIANKKTESQVDTNSCIRKLLTTPVYALHPRPRGYISGTADGQSEVEPCIPNLSVLLNSYRRQFNQRYEDNIYHRDTGPDDVTSCMAGFPLVSDCGSVSGLQAGPFPVPVSLIKNTACSTNISHQTNRVAQACSEEDKGKGLGINIKVTPSDAVKPVPVDFHQSNVDSLASRSEDLEKYVDGRPVNGLSQKIEHCNSESDDNENKCAQPNHLCRRHRVEIQRGINPRKCYTYPKRLTFEDTLHRQVIKHKGEKVFKCKECGKCFNRNLNLRLHEKIHTKEHSLECQDCHKKFTRRRDLERHLSIHRQEKTFNCKECGKCFSQSSDLNVHFLRFHSGDEKSFKCSECGKGYRQIKNLRQHLKTHQGEKPFKCDKCDKSFFQRLYLLEHVRIHTGENPFKCHECGKTFRRASNLRQHLRIHRGENRFKCNLCGKIYSRKVYLLQHAKIHAGEKPFKCNECGKTYLHNESLLYHVRIHTGEN